MNFSKHTYRFLIKAGWEKDRRIDVKPYEQLLQKKGFPVFPAISEFLEQFGGLQFRNVATIPPAVEDWHFQVEVVLPHIFLNNIIAYSKMIHSPLSVIGEASHGHLVLMMDESGRVFGGFDDIFLIVGSSGGDAIEGLCSGRIFQPVVPD